MKYIGPLVNVYPDRLEELRCRIEFLVVLWPRNPIVLGSGASFALSPSQSGGNEASCSQSSPSLQLSPRLCLAGGERRRRCICRTILLAAAAFLLFFLCRDDAQAGPGPVFQSLYSFTNGADGGSPYANLILSGATLYGTASGGGTNGSGTVFAMNTDGTGFRTLYTFSEHISQNPNDPAAPATNSDGAGPSAGLVLSGNTLYGTAAYGGTNGDGTVFAVNTDGTGFRMLHTFNYSDGENPSFGLTLSGNRLYGAAYRGGTNGNNGTVFAVNTDGSGFTTLHSFDAIPDGLAPQCSLVLYSNALYGTSLDDGTNAMEGAGGGTVFAVNTDGTSFRALYAFGEITSPPPIYSNSDGANPYGSLALSANTLYGTTTDGGTNSWGTVFGVNTDGKDFRLLHTFGPAILSNETWSNLDGAIPAAGLVVSGNTLYGTTSEGGTNRVGTVFAVNTDGTGFTVLHTFNGLDGGTPESALLLAGNTLYGTTVGGGTDDAGTIFVITLPSIPAIDPNSMVVAGGQLQFVVNGLTPGAIVYVQASSDLSPTGAWSNVTTNVTAATTLNVSGLSVTNANYRFFRVLEASPF
jgi:uncharacterized repeat protein (TIGR03803 family)